MLSTVRVRSSAAAAALVTALLATAPLAAQQQEQPTEFQSWRLPGWSFTPGIRIGALFDSNVNVSFPVSPEAGTPSDKLYTFEPFGQLEYLSPRTVFSTGYNGSIRRYFSFDELDGNDHRAYLSLRHMLSRRVTLFANDNFIRVPTTDFLELNGVPFRRTGSRYDAFSGGVEARLSRTVDLITRYDLTWVDFTRKDTLLTGGFVNGVHAELSRRLTGRSSFGVEGGVRWADLDEGTRSLLFNETGVVYRYRTGPLTTFEAAVGLARLDDRTRDIQRNGPYARIGLTHRAERATLGVTFERSYVPSFTFGGTNQSQEVRGYLQMPLTRNRLYVQEAGAWRRTDPFVATELPLDSIWINSVVGYELQRWLRLESYYTFTRQNTRLFNGQIHRHIAGAQVVISEPMRIR
jgi:hypothetical protein